MRPGNPPPGMGGVDPTVTIPAISVTQPDGTLLKANAPLTVGFAVDPAFLQGADNAGRPRLYMPNPVPAGLVGLALRHGAVAECADGTGDQRFAERRAATSTSRRTC